MTNDYSERGANPGASSGLTPGVYVTNTDRPDWGLGQVQSVVGTRVTVNFENAGKLTLNIANVPLVAAAP